MDKNMKKCMSLTFEVIRYDDKEGILLYKPLEIIKDNFIDIRTNELLTSDGKKLYPMESMEIIRKNLDYCFGFPIYNSSIEDAFNLKTQELENIDIEKEKNEIIENNFKELFFNIYFGSYDPDGIEKKVFEDEYEAIEYLLKDEITVIYAWKKDIKNFKENGWFYNFHSDDIFIRDYDTEDGNSFELTHENIENIINMLKHGYTNKIIDYFERAENYLDEKETKTPNIEDFKPKEELTLEEALNRTEPFLNELNSLVGIKNVKSYVKTIENYLIFLNKVKNETSFEKPKLHMIFTGNPGTGKTTVARIISKIFYSLGYTQNDKFAEITTGDLIGQYVGETAGKATKLLNKYRGGVVFIDEAYTFADPGQTYGDEALSIILKEMDKDDITFIFAGYEKEMNNFINMNSGLQSRISNFINFRDYSIDELIKMFNNKVNKTKMKLDKDAEKEIKNIIERAKENRNFGNGRFIDKLYEKIIFNHANNTSESKDLKELIIITNKDIIDINEDELLYDNETKNEIGFALTKK